MDMIGTHIGPFVVLRLLGAGGMGSVYLAQHVLMKDLHAIKVLDPQLTQNPQIVARFVNEARAAAMLRHRNLVRVHNIERGPSDGPWFMVLDYLEGSTLARFMTAHREPLAPHLILHILAQVANCMQHVHDHKIIHRDLKPDNIFLIRHGDDPHFPVVLDLGVAQLNEDLASGPATKTGTVLGTPIYMAPEQLRGERVSPAADVFALGAIAYEMSTGGFLPFQYDEPRSAYFELPPTEIYYRQRSAPARDPRRRHPGLSEAWAKALGAALELDPRARPASVQAFALLLAEAVPADGDHPDGLAIVRQVAHELTQVRAPDLDMIPPRSPREVTRITHLPGNTPPGVHSALATTMEQTTVRDPPSTLGGAASQSLAGVRATRRRSMIAGAGAAALIASAATAVAVVRWGGPTDARPDDGRPRTTTRIAGEQHAPAAPITSALPAATDRSSEAIRPPAVPALTARPTAHDPPAKAPSKPTGTSARPAPQPTGARVYAAGPPGVGELKKPGELAILVKPWAMISLNGKSLGQTPFRGNVPAGRYRLQLTNDVTGKDETTFITVNPDETTTVQRTW
jgi:serine/threonine protein kinase